jgi:hypothetical protein
MYASWPSRILNSLQCDTLTDCRMNSHVEVLHVDHLTTMISILGSLDLKHRADQNRNEEAQDDELAAVREPFFRFARV